MASTNGTSTSTSKSYFEQQRELLIGDVAASLESVLQNINKLNRSLEGVIAVNSIAYYSVRVSADHQPGR
jgi:DASH complex subunit DAD1